jgi:hypothetical protein
MKEKKGDKDVERFLEAAIDNNHSHNILFFRRRIIIALQHYYLFNLSICASFFLFCSMNYKEVLTPLAK